MSAVGDEANVADEPQRATERIVVAFDGSSEARAAVDTAIAMQAPGETAEIVLVCGHQRPPDFSRHPRTGALIPTGTWPAEWSTSIAAQMEHEVLRIRLAGCEARALCSAEDLDVLLLTVGGELEAKAIVVPDERRGFWSDLIFGSVARRLAHASKIPVVVVPRDRRSSA